MRKLLVTDIDGTMAHNDHIPESVLDTCALLRDQGWEIMVATGRILASARKHIRDTGSLDHAIVYDGARIMSEGTGEEIWGSRLTPETVEWILEAVWDLSPGIQVFGDEEVFCRPGDNLAKKYFSGLGVPVRSDLEEPRRIDEIFRIIIHGEPCRIQGVGDEIGRSLRGRARSVLAGRGFLDILPPGASKGSALERMIGSESGCGKGVLVAAAGDHLNDLELLEAADISITMRDAPEELLEVADFILPPASEEGFSNILDILRKFGK